MCVELFYGQCVCNDGLVILEDISSCWFPESQNQLSLRLKGTLGILFSCNTGNLESYRLTPNLAECFTCEVTNSTLDLMKMTFCNACENKRHVVSAGHVMISVSKLCLLLETFVCLESMHKCVF